MERFEYLLLGKELKAQTDIAKKQYQGLQKVFISNNDNKNVNDSFIKKKTKVATFFSVFTDSVFTVILMIKNLIASLSNQNIQIY